MARTRGQVRRPGSSSHAPPPVAAAGETRDPSPPQATPPPPPPEPTQADATLPQSKKSRLTSRKQPRSPPRRSSRLPSRDATPPLPAAGRTAESVPVTTETPTPGITSGGASHPRVSTAGSESPLSHHSLPPPPVVSPSSVAHALTGGSCPRWKSGGLEASSLTASYFGLFRILCSNWSPCTHLTTVFRDQARLLYMIGTGADFSLGKHIFNIICRLIHWRKNQGVLGFPCLISHILLSQHSVLRPGEEAGTPSALLTVAPKTLGARARRSTSHRGSSSHTRSRVQTELDFLDTMERRTQAQLRLIHARRAELLGSSASLSADSSESD